MERDPLPYGRMYSFSIAAIINLPDLKKKKQPRKLIFKLQF